MNGTNTWPAIIFCVMIPVLIVGLAWWAASPKLDRMRQTRIRNRAIAARRRNSRKA